MMQEYWNSTCSTFLTLGLTSVDSLSTRRRDCANAGWSWVPSIPSPETTTISFSEIKIQLNGPRLLPSQAGKLSTSVIDCCLICTVSFTTAISMVELSLDHFSTSQFLNQLCSFTSQCLSYLFLI